MVRPGQQKKRRCRVLFGRTRPGHCPREWTSDFGGSLPAAECLKWVCTPTGRQAKIGCLEVVSQSRRKGHHRHNRISRT